MSLALATLSAQHVATVEHAAAFEIATHELDAQLAVIGDALIERLGDAIESGVRAPEFTYEGTPHHLTVRAISWSRDEGKRSRRFRGDRRARGSARVLEIGKRYVDEGNVGFGSRGLLAMPVVDEYASTTARGLLESNGRWPIYYRLAPAELRLVVLGVLPDLLAQVKAEQARREQLLACAHEGLTGALDALG